MKVESKIWEWNDALWRLWWTKADGSDLGWEIDIRLLTDPKVYMHPVPVTPEGQPLYPAVVGGNESTHSNS